MGYIVNHIVLMKKFRQTSEFGPLGWMFRLPLSAVGRGTSYRPLDRVHDRVGSAGCPLA